MTSRSETYSEDWVETFSSGRPSEFPDDLTGRLTREVQKSSHHSCVYHHLFTKPYPLTPAQCRAVLHEHRDSRPVLVRAGPGSGKTTVMTRRYLLMLLRGHRISEILAVTFTRQAAQEMKYRIRNRLETFRDISIEHGDYFDHLLSKIEAGDHWITTFHTAASRILKFSCPSSDSCYLSKISEYFNSDFEIVGLEQQLNFVEEVSENRGGLSGYSPRRVLRTISHWRVNLVPPDEALEISDSDIELISARIYRDMMNKKQREGVVDYHDLIYYAGLLIRRNPEIRRQLRKKFKFVLVDEFQDTNPAQQLIVSKLTEDNRSLFAVGDEKQAIYGWRGATHQMFVNFRDFYPNAEAITLDVNFRSKALITFTANEIAERLPSGSTGVMDPPRRDGESLDYGNSPGLFQADTGDEEQEFLCYYVEKLVEEHGYDYSDIAILVRLNRFKTKLKENLRKQSIPVVELGSAQFFRRRTTQTFLSCLKCIRDIYRCEFGTDDVSDDEVLPVYWSTWSTSEIGPLESSQEEFLNEFNDVRDLLESMRRSDSAWNRLGNRFRRRFRKSVGTLLSIANDLYQGVFLLELESDLKKLFFVPGQRILHKHLRECFTWARQNISRDGLPGLVGLINTANFQRHDPQFSISSSKSGVCLNTIHGAKGMEFPVVMMPGLEEGWLPRDHEGGFHSSDVVEERRLFYVGVTRAEEELIMSYSRNREINDRDQPRKPSRYIEEIPPEYLETRQRDKSWLNWLRGIFDHVRE